MTLRTTPLHQLFAAQLLDVDLRTLKDVSGLLSAMDTFAVCVVRHPVPLSDSEHIDFSRKLGLIEDRQVLVMTGTRATRIPHHEIIDQSNLDDTGAIYADGDRRLGFKRANRLWHTDISFHPIRATYSLLSAHVVPPVPANTEFADMRAVYDALPATMKARLDGLVAEHSYWHSRVLGGGPEPTDEEFHSRPPARHQLVHVHPRSGRKSLYLASHIRRIEGMADGEASALLEGLNAFATQPKFVFAHRWRVGDVVIWDNLATMHRATPFDDRTHIRDMRRTTCRERPVTA